MSQEIKQETSLDIASEFIDYQNPKDVIDFIYDDKKIDVAAIFGTSSKEDLINAITYDDTKNNAHSKQVEEMIVFVSDVIATYLITLNDEDYITFAKNYYDEDFQLTCGYIEC